jgi:putative chitinase
MLLKLFNLNGHIPDAVIAMIPDTAVKFQIDTPLRLAHFLAQCGHESNGFKATRENLNYSAKGLMSTFKKYFPTYQLSTAYERKPEKIANLVYASRMGNGDEHSGDGYKYRGRGALQLTGKDNYKAFSDYCKRPDIMTNPDLISGELAFESAMWFFEKNHIWELCDKGTDDATITAVTKKVNGGTIGLEDRIKHTHQYAGWL